MMSACAGVTAPYRRSSLRRTARAVGVAAETKARRGADEERAAIGCLVECLGCKIRTIAARKCRAIKSPEIEEPRGGTRMELVPLGPGFGVEVRGVSLLDVAS